MKWHELTELLKQRQILADRTQELGSKYADMLHEFTSQLNGEKVFAVDNQHFLYREGKVKKIPVIGETLPNTPVSDEYRKVLIAENEYRTAIQELHSINQELRFLVNEHLNLINAQNCLICVDGKAYLLDSNYPVETI